MTKKEPFSLKINFTINAENIKSFWGKIKTMVYVMFGSGFVAHGTFKYDFYINIGKKLGLFVESLFK